MTISQHQRTQAHVLIQKLLSLRDRVSPLNVIHDTLEQSARPLLYEFVLRAKASRIQTIYVSLDSPRAPFPVQHFLRARRRSVQSIYAELRALSAQNEQNLVIFDSADFPPEHDQSLINMVSGLAGDNASVVVVVHSGEPTGTSSMTPYTPNHLYMLDYLATTIFGVSSIEQTKTCHLAAKSGRAEPTFGLESGTEGIVVGLGANTPNGLQVQVEHRRKSGRSIGLVFILRPHKMATTSGKVTLFDEDPVFGKAAVDNIGSNQSHGGITFNLSLTEQQREARDEVVLPYYDAQHGQGTGGRILYDLGREDDFDEEEDEI